LVIMDEPWLYYYDPETKQLSMEWRHSVSHLPKTFWVQKSAGTFLPRFFSSRRHPPHFLSSKGPNYRCRVLFISAGAIEGYFEGKMLWEVHQVGLVLARQCPGSPGTCNPEEIVLPGLPLSPSPILFSISGPVGLPPVPWAQKTIERSPLFVRRRGHCCRGDLVGRTTFWTFFEWLAKVRATGKEVYWASLGVRWINPEFVRCSLFPS